MKLDGESAYCHTALVQKPNSKFVECNNIVNENGVLCDDLKGSERDIVSLSTRLNRDGLWNVSEFDCSTSDDSTNANEDETRHFEEPYCQKDMEFYNAKSVMECELPELIVCYKESHENVIKDICIDKEVTSLGQILFGQRNILSYDEDKVSTISTSDGLKSSEDEDCCKDSTRQCAFVDPMQTYSANDDINDMTEEKFVPSKDENEVKQQSVEEAMLETPALVSAAEESNNDIKKSNESPLLASEVEEPDNNSLANDIVYDSKVENGSITFNFDSTGGDESSQNGNHNPPETQNVSKLEEISETVPIQVRDSPGESSFSLAGLGESSFSVTGPMSGLITYSGPIAYSGSCSLRSESSTTSTRSFAFPVLQAEWNSSPVRMRKADRRKLSGWRQGLLCCRF